MLMLSLILKAYGYPDTGTNGPADSSWVSNNGSPYTSIAGEAKTRVDYRPLYFVRTGSIYPNTGSLRYAGLSGYYWSNTTYPESTTRVYNLYFDTGNVIPSDRNARYSGFADGWVTYPGRRASPQR